MRILDTPNSAHFPVQLAWTLTVQRFLPPPISAVRFIWKQTARDAYQETIVQQFSSINEDLPLYDQIIGCIQAAALATGMARHIDGIQVTKNSQPWFDKECSSARKSTSLALRDARTLSWNSEQKSNFLVLKKSYKKMCRTKKRAHWDQKRDQLNSSTTQQQFWKNIRPFRPRPSGPNVVPESAWIQFYSTLMPLRTLYRINLSDVRHPTLDQPITPAEVVTSLQKLATHKTPGPDGIRNEFLKSLPSEAVLNCNLL